MGRRVSSQQSAGGHGGDLTKGDACEAFMDLLVFNQAGKCELKQEHLGDVFSDRFSIIEVYRLF